jgi:hypothetical protein
VIFVDYIVVTIAAEGTDQNEKWQLTDLTSADTNTREEVTIWNAKTGSAFNW